MAIALDLDLTTEDISRLTSADALAAFFQRLGYSTTKRATIPAQAVGIDGLSDIRHIELVGIFKVRFLKRLESSIAAFRLSWGGVRWWFICPLTVNGRYCGRRVGKLYLPSGGSYFGCRYCYDLTYTSCQESHKFDSMWADIGRSLNLSPDQVRLLMRE